MTNEQIRNEVVYEWADEHFVGKLAEFGGNSDDLSGVFEEYKAFLIWHIRTAYEGELDSDVLNKLYEFAQRIGFKEKAVELLKEEG